MLICFGLSWPVSIIKSIRTKVVAGKSILFMAVIAVGYLCGLAHKLLYSRDWIMFLYIFNLAMVMTDIMLYLKYSQKREVVPVEYGGPSSSRETGKTSLR